MKKLSEEQLAKNRAYHATHRKEIRARKKAAYAALSEQERLAENAKRRAYHAENRDEALRKRREKYAIEGRGKIDAWEAAHPEKVRQMQRQADEKRNTPQRIAQKKARYHERPIEEHRARQAKWRAENPELVRAAHHRRKALLRGAARNDLTAEQWATIQDHFGHKCVYCGVKSKKLTQDHIIPLSKGGDHSLHNIVPACLSCNCSKHNGPPPIPVQPLLL